MMPDLDALVAPLLGKPCWNVQWHRMTNLSMNFGQPSLDIHEPYASTAESALIRERASYRTVSVHGAWFLWIYMAHWTLQLRDGRVTTGSSSQRSRRALLVRLDGQQLMGIAIQPKTGRTRLDFDLGATLDIRRYGPANDELWLLYLPDGRVLTVRGDGQASLVHGDHPATEEEPWFPIPADWIVSR